MISRKNVSLFFLIALVSQFVDGEFKCGYSKYHHPQRDDQDNDERIIGGKEARPHQFPWMVYVRVYHFQIGNSSNVGGLRCDGTLFNRQWILSAGHCVRKFTGFKMKSIKLTLGAHNLDDESEVRLETYAELYVKQTLLDYEHCKPINPEISRKQICAGTLNETVCNGDSGGPLEFLIIVSRHYSVVTLLVLLNHLRRTRLVIHGQLGQRPCWDYELGGEHTNCVIFSFCDSAVQRVVCHQSGFQNCNLFYKQLIENVFVDHCEEHLNFKVHLGEIDNKKTKATTKTHFMEQKTTKSRQLLIAPFVEGMVAIGTLVFGYEAVQFAKIFHANYQTAIEQTKLVQSDILRIQQQSNELFCELTRDLKPFEIGIEIRKDYLKTSISLKEFVGKATSKQDFSKEFKVVFGDIQLCEENNCPLNVSRFDGFYYFH
ncbi:hypothetical protein RDWZM_002118 [Blomia tropicalis]|uniref:Peptidase S1 domain-containing protein n=1 Tax=Blomia tropicalis TaxID=40697 RepID=A0A9Q0MED6_BLOTA|nr:hypothetical protein RDWZM_002118 [Blomia tropicalis]